MIIASGTVKLDYDGKLVKRYLAGKVFEMPPKKKKIEIFGEKRRIFFFCEFLFCRQFLNDVLSMIYIVTYHKKNIFFKYIL